jgi:hypothetical protein
MREEGQRCGVIYNDTGNVMPNRNALALPLESPNAGITEDRGVWAVVAFSSIGLAVALYFSVCSLKSIGQLGLLLSQAAQF